MSRKAKSEEERSEASVGGRPTDYRDEFCQQVEKLCKLGATDIEIADFFGKAVSTINLWKKEHPEFSEAIKRGKVVADIDVANSLFKKATGYTQEVEKVIGKGDDRRVVTVKVPIEPDTTAAIFWLKNRRKDHWRDKQEVDMNVRNHEDALAELE